MKTQTTDQRVLIAIYMSILDKNEIREAFKKEAGSLINKIGKELSRLSNKQQTTSYKLQMFSLLRYAHTLKGIAGICGYYEMEKSAKSITEVFRAAKNGELEISPKDKVSIKKNLNECEKLLKKKG